MFAVKPGVIVRSLRVIVNLRRAGEDGLSSVVVSRTDADPAAQ